MLTHYASIKVLDLISGRANSVQFGSTSMYVGLSTQTPTAAPANNWNVAEPAVNGYARVLIGAYGQTATYKIGVAASGASTNTDIIFFPEATGAWGTCTHFLIFDASVNGNLIAFGELLDDQGDPTTIAPGNGDVPIVRAGALDITLA